MEHRECEDDKGGMTFATRTSDVVWNYIGTFFSMASNFLLIPLLLLFLSTEQIGLWYVFTAISGFSQLLEFGFTSTLSRNILYCLNGARRLTKRGFDPFSVEPGIDWHLTRVVLKTSKAIYAAVGLIALAVASTLGSAYIFSVTDGFAIPGSLLSWLVFLVSIFSNLYFLYCLTFLRGIGDVAGENKAKTIARVSQLVVTALLLVAGLGLIAAAIGFFINSILMRLAATWLFSRNMLIRDGLTSDSSPVGRDEMRDVFGTVSFVAWRDGVVSLAWYGATQAMSLLCSAFLGLAETATYSVLLQFTNAMYNISSVNIRSSFPAFQAAYVAGDQQVQQDVLSRGISAYVMLYATVTLVVTAFLPVLGLFKSDFMCDRWLFVGLSVYYFLLSQHSLFCMIIVSMNEIPYFKAYIVTTAFGIALSTLLCGIMGFGSWGLVLGQAIPQLAYNNWRWPKYVLDREELSYRGIMINGICWWRDQISALLPIRKRVA